MTTALIEQDAVLPDRGRPSFLDCGDELTASSASRQLGPYKAMLVVARSEAGSRFIPDAALITSVTSPVPMQTKKVLTWPSRVWWTVQVNVEAPAAPLKTPFDEYILGTITCHFALYGTIMENHNLAIARLQIAPEVHYDVSDWRVRVMEPEVRRLPEPNDSYPIINSWLAEALEFEAAGRSEEALDTIFGTLDDWLLDGDFAQCSTFLDTVSIDKLETSHLLTILTATLPAKKELPGRSSFFRRVRVTLEQRGEDAESLLSGL